VRGNKEKIRRRSFTAALLLVLHVCMHGKEWLGAWGMREKGMRCHVLREKRGVGSHRQEKIWNRSIVLIGVRLE
jgi:hypothetical protein